LYKVSPPQVIGDAALGPVQKSDAKGRAERRRKRATQCAALDNQHLTLKPEG
jgi:hypothetical protein